MAIEIKMPALSPTMTEGRLSRWLVGTGDKVASGDVIAEIETDKATMEVEAISAKRTAQETRFLNQKFDKQMRETSLNKSKLARELKKHVLL